MSDVADVLARGRDFHLDLLLDACLIKHPTGQSIDPDTDVITITYDTVYDDAEETGAGGPCRIKPFQSGHATVAGESPLELQRYDVQIPWDATGPVVKNDIVLITSSDDPWVVDASAGKPLTVIDPQYSGTTTVRHVIVEDRS